MRLAFNIGISTWEWDEGLRNWLVPGLFAGQLKLLHAIGVDGVWARRAFIAVPVAALHLAGLVAIWRLAARRVGPNGALAAAALCALSSPTLGFAGRTLSEP